jgi:hypothetical protein
MDHSPCWRSSQVAARSFEVDVRQGGKLKRASPPLL